MTTTTFTPAAIETLAVNLFSTFAAILGHETPHSWDLVDVDDPEYLVWRDDNRDGTMSIVALNEYINGDELNKALTRAEATSDDDEQMEICWDIIRDLVEDKTIAQRVEEALEGVTDADEISTVLTAHESDVDERDQDWANERTAFMMYDGSIITLASDGSTEAFDDEDDYYNNK